ncbi:interleukin-22 receptor subunit alpha-1 [Hyperolius riggenbachi]|uniref:interleukin-22 receptor subunit alpha-1 n=1 Tax=Hyperolius riggenbachi TaxID=752182 RepID=UPI0035A29BF7
MRRTQYYLLLIYLSMNICHCCLNFTHQDVTFNATNFEYVLQWNNANLPSDVTFSVQYKRYGDTKWILFPECENITDVYCDLTNAITGDIQHFMENEYIGRVRASTSNCSTDWIMSKRLHPRDDTFLILPKLNFTEHVNSITIIVPTPPTPMRIKDGQLMTVEDLYSTTRFEYFLNFFNPEKHSTWQKTQKHGNFKVSGLRPNTEYNGSVYIRIANERKSDIRNFVVKTLPDHSLVTLVCSLIAIFAVVLSTGILYAFCKYVKQHAKMPNSLDFREGQRIQILTPQKEKYSACTTGFSQMLFLQLYDPLINSHQSLSGNVDPVSYASQGHPFASGTESSLHTQTSYAQQNNDMTFQTDVYGGLFEDSNYNPQQQLQRNDQLSLQDMDSATWRESGSNDGNFNLLLEHEPNTGLAMMSPLALISSVVVDDGNNDEHTEEAQPALLTHLSFDDFPNGSVEDNALEDHFQVQESSQYRLQNPIECPQNSVTAGDLYCEQPYRLQNSPNNLLVP